VCHVDCQLVFLAAKQPSITFFVASPFSVVLQPSAARRSLSWFTVLSFATPSGESGAGKTETSKHIVRQVIELCRAGNTELEDKLLVVNPLLEAFGNAKTGEIPRSP
jgi:hypothetical protein